MGGSERREGMQMGGGVVPPSQISGRAPDMPR